jgi:hypothetical protein
MRRSRLGQVCAGVDAASQRITTTWLNILLELSTVGSDLRSNLGRWLFWLGLGWTHAYFKLEIISQKLHFI